MINLDLNQNFFDLFFGLAYQSTFYDFLGIFLADYLQYFLAAIFIFLFFSKNHRKQHRTMVLVSTMSAITALYVVKPLIVFFYAAPRPFMVLDINPLIKVMTIENLQSFPSGHTLFFFALGTAVFLFNKKIGIWFLVAATLISLSRIYVGVHWPIDILAGVVLGVLTGIFTHYLYRRFGQRKLAK